MTTYWKIGIPILGLVLLSQSVFLIDQTKQALVLRIGRAVGVIENPGLHLKIPFIENILTYDKRLLNISINFTPDEVIAADRKRVIVNAYAKFRIVDTLRFYEKVGSEDMLQRLLNPILESTLREEVGQVSLQSLLTNKRIEVMSKIRASVNHKTQKFGIHVVDVRIMRTDLPQENSEAIYRRMETTHEKEARQTRAQGAEEAQRIKSRADRDQKVLLADAEKQAAILQGEGEAMATKIFAAAYTKNEDFFEFYRTMQLYHNTLNKDNTSLILSPDNSILRPLYERP